MRIFVDTSAWFALGDQKDQHHREAAMFLGSMKDKPVLLITTDYVVDETLTLLRFKVSHKAALAFLRTFARESQVVRHQVSQDHLRRAEEIFAKYRDKLWSFTDCVSFAYMEEKGLEDAFAFDTNFSQFGVRVQPHH